MRKKITSIGFILIQTGVTIWSGFVMYNNIFSCRQIDLYCRVMYFSIPGTNQFTYVPMLLKILIEGSLGLLAFFSLFTYFKKRESLKKIVIIQAALGLIYITFLDVVVPYEL